eukprot:g2790.t1
MLLTLASKGYGYKPLLAFLILLILPFCYSSISAQVQEEGISYLKDIWQKVRVDSTVVSGSIRGSRPWLSVHMSTDGNIVAALEENGLWISRNSGYSYTKVLSTNNVYSERGPKNEFGTPIKVNRYKPTRGTRSWGWTETIWQVEWLDMENGQEAKDMLTPVFYMSSSGERMLADVVGGSTWISTDSGKTWFEKLPKLEKGANLSIFHHSASHESSTSEEVNNSVTAQRERDQSYSHPRRWKEVISQKDKRKVALDFFGRIFHSVDSGRTWTINVMDGVPNGSAVRWGGVKPLLGRSNDSSSQGNVSILTTESTSDGTNTNLNDKDVRRLWRSIASSKDGKTLAVAELHGNIWFSRDAGETWSESPVGGGHGYWSSLAFSGDGKKMAAVVHNGLIWVTNFDCLDFSKVNNPLDWSTVHPENHVCRPAKTICDVSDLCDGNVVACPRDIFQSNDVVVNASTGPCDPTETCSGVDAEIPIDANALFCDHIHCTNGTIVASPAEDGQGAISRCICNDGYAGGGIWLEGPNYPPCTLTTAGCDAVGMDASQPASCHCKIGYTDKTNAELSQKSSTMMQEGRPIRWDPTSNRWTGFCADRQDTCSGEFAVPGIGSCECNDSSTGIPVWNKDKASWDSETACKANATGNDPWEWVDEDDNDHSNTENTEAESESAPESESESGTESETEDETEKEKPKTDFDVDVEEEEPEPGMEAFHFEYSLALITKELLGVKKIEPFYAQFVDSMKSVMHSIKKITFKNDDSKSTVTRADFILRVTVYKPIGGGNVEKPTQSSVCTAVQHEVDRVTSVTSPLRDAKILCDSSIQLSTNSEENLNDVTKDESNENSGMENKETKDEEEGGDEGKGEKDEQGEKEEKGDEEEKDEEETQPVLENDNAEVVTFDYNLAVVTRELDSETKNVDFYDRLKNSMKSTFQSIRDISFSKDDKMSKTARADFVLQVIVYKEGEEVVVKPLREGVCKAAQNEVDSLTAAGNLIRGGLILCDPHNEKDVESTAPSPNNVESTTPSPNDVENTTTPSADSEKSNDSDESKEKEEEPFNSSFVKFDYHFAVRTRKLNEEKKGVSMFARLSDALKKTFSTIRNIKFTNDDRKSKEARADFTLTVTLYKQQGLTVVKPSRDAVCKRAQTIVDDIKDVGNLLQGAVILCNPSSIQSNNSDDASTSGGNTDDSTDDSENDGDRTSEGDKTSKENENETNKEETDNDNEGTNNPNKGDSNTTNKGDSNNFVGDKENNNKKPTAKGNKGTPSSNGNREVGGNPERKGQVEKQETANSLDPIVWILLLIVLLIFAGLLCMFWRAGRKESQNYLEDDETFTISVGPQVDEEAESVGPQVDEEAEV